jgi:hypothetical protein
MTLLTDHIWLVGLLAMFLNVVIGRVRMRAMVARGALTDREANRFCLNAAVVLVVVYGLFEIVMLLTGLSAQCQLLLPLTQPSSWPFHGLTLLCGAALLFWVWKRGGDRTLAKFAPAFMRGAGRDTSYTPGQVRLWSTVTLVIAWGGYLGMRFAAPMPTQAEMPFCAQAGGGQRGKVTPGP